MQHPVFMDYHSTTPVDPRVLERMLPYFIQDFGNAASRAHSYGWKAEEAVDQARSQIAQLIGCNAVEIVFTSGATESNNLALLGVMEAYAKKGNHLITQVSEHKAVLDVCQALEKRGCQISYLPVDAEGRVNPEDLQKAITPATVLCSIMHINNEIGTIQPLATIGSICRQAQILLHSDAAQSGGVLPLNVDALQVDLLSLSAHKMYGPKGIGALYVRRRNPRVTLAPQIHGGGHERGFRSGTLNVPGIVGFGEAARLTLDEGLNAAQHLRTLRDTLQEALFTGLSGIYLNGPQNSEERHPGNLNIALSGVEGETLLLALQKIALSSGSACTSATMQPSHVLRALGRSPELAHNSLRFGLGRLSTLEEVHFVAKEVCERVGELRARFKR